MGKSPEELYQERAKRVWDVISLKEPDRVPFLPTFTFFPVNYAGLSCEEAMYDYDKMGAAYRKALLDLEPDMFNSPYLTLAIGPLLEILDYKLIRWPGHGVAPDKTYQFVEGEYMKAEEYDDFLFDPTDYMLHTYLPRVCGALAGFSRLPNFPMIYYTRFVAGLTPFGEPEVGEAFEALRRAGVESQRLVSKAVAFGREMQALGFPAQYGAFAIAPFDYIGDFFRGTRGIMVDIYRRPEKLLALLDKVTHITIQSTLRSVQASSVPVVFIPLHKGIDGFMSLEHFKTFYWGSLRQLILALIDAGLTPCVFWEGHCESRLETIRDIPKGKAMYRFEQTDFAIAKEVLGDTVCIRGNVPASLLCTGSPEEVTAYCKNLIDVAGKGGGLIMDGAIGIPDEAKPENALAMARATREYGCYG